MNHRTIMAIALTGVFGAAGWAQANNDKKGGHEHELSMMDSDGDGKISAEEHAAGAKKMFEMMDADKDGKVTAAEMEAAHEKVAGEKAKKGEKGEMSAAAKIKVIDTNADGVLTAEEHTAGAKTMFEKMDTNKDGYVSKAELTAGHAKMMHKK
jgi:Ca2+-binding EF-hand superfamily protein